MKKILILSLFLVSSFGYGQEVKKEKAESGDRLDYYVFKNNSLIHFRATGEAETVLIDVSLMNGIVITAKGELVAENGTRQKLLDGECVNGEGRKSECTVLEQNLRNSLKVKEKE